MDSVILHHKYVPIHICREYLKSSTENFHLASNGAIIHISKLTILFLDIAIKRRIERLRILGFCLDGFDLKGKVAVVTGGASGIGKAICARLANNRAQVWVLDIDGAAAETTAAEITQAGGHAYALPCNVADPESVSSAFATIAAKGPSIFSSTVQVLRISAPLRRQHCRILNASSGSTRRECFFACRLRLPSWSNSPEA